MSTVESKDQVTEIMELIAGLIDSCVALNEAGLNTGFAAGAFEGIERRLRALAAPVVSDAPTGEFELTRSIIHECPALKLPQTLLQKLGMTAQLVVLKGASPEIAKFILDSCNRAALAASPVVEDAPIELRLCESERLVLRPDQPYIFTVDPECESCKRVAAAYTDAPAPLSVGKLPDSATASVSGLSEPTEWIDDDGRLKWALWRIKDLEAKLAAKVVPEAPTDEPVAWRWVPSIVWQEYVVTTDSEKARVAKSHGMYVEPLYTHPPAKEGWISVPAEPTTEMLQAMVKSREGPRTYSVISEGGLRSMESDAQDDYRAAIAAAPTPTKE